MRITLKFLKLLLFAALLVSGINLSAAEYNTTVTEALNAQDRRIQQLEAQLASLGQSVHNEQQSCCEDLDDCCACESCPGWIGGVEGTMLKAHNNALALNVVAPPLALQVLPGTDYEFAPRVWLGYQFAGGLGFRATYWTYEHSVASANIPGLVTGLEATTTDLELTQTGSFCSWDLTTSAGMRYGRIENALTIPLGAPPINLLQEFEGVGATLALNARRPVGSGGLALIGGARASLLYGNNDATIDLTGAGIGVGAVSLVADQQTLEIFELRLGAEWSRDLGNGARFFTQTAYEAQVWNVAPIALGLLDSQVGFSGLAFNIGIAR